MARETLVPRRYGSEIEYGMTLSKKAVALYEDKGAFYLPRLMPPGIIYMDDFLENGARLYVDQGKVEYATPTCGTIADLIKHEIVGERHIWDAYGNGKSNIDTFYKRSNNHLADPKSSTTGAHENYSIARSTNYDDLETHLATRTPYIGAGYSLDNQYGIGQKTANIGFDGKKFYEFKDEDIEEGLNLIRLEVKSGDANMSPWAIRMKFGTTSLVLRLMEHKKDISDLSLADPYASARLVAQSVEGMSKPLELKSGRTATALNLQEELAARAFLLSQEIELPEEEPAIIPVWMETIDSLKKDRTLEQADWYAKKQLIDMASERKRSEGKGDLTSEQEMLIDFRYSKIPDGLGTKLRERTFAPHMLPEEEIDEARKVPPEGRSQLLGNIIKKIGPRYKFSVGVNWSYLTHGENHSLGPVEAVYTDEEIEELSESIAIKLRNRRRT